MNTKLLSILIMGAALGISSCQNGNKEKTATEEPASVETTVTSDSNDIVNSSITDEAGNTLDMKFDNAAGTATFVFAGDTILLKRDTTASGIQFSNDHYVYTEHHGEATLSKDGSIVFKKGN
jgi:membrane-bound inhibitor of C-type lysozyme